VSPQTDRGFTLIELLVVMVIIAIVASIAVISVNVASREPAKEQAQKLADIAGLAAEQAVMQGQEYGLRIEAHAYTLYSYDGRNWQPVKDDELLSRHELGNDVSLSLQTEGTPVTLAPPPATVQDLSASTTAASAAATGGSEQSQNVPQVLLLSSGEMAPFEVDVTGTASGAVYKVKGTLADGITVIEPEAKSIDHKTPP
jgi:general secretion pathway protein H